VYSFLYLIHTFILKLFERLQPYLGPVCLVLAWGGVMLGLWNLFATVRDSLNRAKTMHQIPCADCKYFTNQAALKCPVHPAEALTENAIGCSDFETANSVWAANLRRKAAQNSH
jgi:hypothetical protein